MTEDAVQPLRQINIQKTIFPLTIICFIDLVLNSVTSTANITDQTFGILILYFIAVAGLIMAKISPIKIPLVAWISILAIIITLPALPTTEWVLTKVKTINFISLATPVLAYAGLAILKKEIDLAKKSGWKISIVALFVFFGTYAGSTLVSELILMLS